MSDAKGLRYQRYSYIPKSKSLYHFALLYPSFDPLLRMSKSGVCSTWSKRNIQGFRKLKEKKNRCMLSLGLYDLLPWLTLL